jgi:hypothetical protein
MAIFDFFLSRNNAASTPANYIGHRDRLFYESSTGEIRISDGATAGGLPIPISIATTSTVGGIKPGAGFLVSNTGTLTLNAGPSFYLDETNTFRLRPGSADQIGGIKAGPGIVIDSEGTLFIDSEGLEFSFGDFTALVGTYTDTTEYALLSSIQANEDIVIASNGTGGIKVVGEFRVYRTNGSITGSLEDEDPFFRVKEDGQVRILVPAEDPIEGGIEIIGSATGTYIPPGQTGTMLQLTGNPNVPCRVYQDTLGNYSSYVARRYNGSMTSTTQVLAGEDVFRINATAATNAGLGNVSLAQISFTALENQTTSTQGSEIGFTVTPVGAAATSRVKVLKVDGVGVTTDRLVKARNYEGAVRDAGSVGGTTVTLDWAADHMVHCVFTDNFTVAFSNYTAGRTITLIATNTSGFDTDIITAGISSVRMQGDSTLTVTEQTTAIITYYCVGTTVNDVYASAVYA